MGTSVVQHRRALHQIPELDRDLPKTIAYVQSVLQTFDCSITQPVEGSVCAFFDGGREETVAIRADMDALPVTETNDTAYTSRHTGRMHACGHDGHTAIALATAEWVNDHLDKLSCNVLFLFQPAEETTGGAKNLCESGILEAYQVRYIFGLHLWPGLPTGEVFARPGPMMARSSEVTVTITGKSVHISKVHEGRDAMLAGIAYLERMYRRERTAVWMDEPRVLRFGKMESGTVRNAISGKTVLQGSLRTFRDSSFHTLCKCLREVGEEIQQETGCEVTVYNSEGYPPVWNDEALFEKVCQALGNSAPKSLKEPALAAEDFSFYQRAVPGVFFFLGTGNTAPLHSPTFDFDDEAILPKGVSFMTQLLSQVSFTK